MLNLSKRAFLGSVAGGSLLALVGCASSTPQQSAQAIGKLLLTGMSVAESELVSLLSPALQADLNGFLQAANAAVAQLPSVVGAVPHASVVKAIVAAVQAFVADASTLKVPSTVVIVLQSLLDALPYLAQLAGLTLAASTRKAVYTPQQAIWNLQQVSMLNTFAMDNNGR